jgi:hypothetical protein
MKKVYQKYPGTEISKSYASNKMLLIYMGK